MYQLFGMEVSPYSVKVRALLRHKGLPHQWVLRSRANEAAFRAKARIPVIPLLVTPEGEGLQDSTPLMDYLEAHHPARSIRLADAGLNFLSDALEEAADEWLIKPMFHYRWNFARDREDAAMRIAVDSVDPGTDPAPFATLIGGVLMSRRDGLGCMEANAPLLERYMETSAILLDQHLQTRRFLFGEQLSAADLGLGSLYYELLSDPTPSSRLQDHAALRRWAADCMSPASAEGPVESWDGLMPTLLPIIRHELVNHYLPWACANAEALAAEQTSLTVALSGATFTQPPQKYAGKSFRQLQARWLGLDATCRERLTLQIPELRWLDESSRTG